MKLIAFLLGVAAGAYGLHYYYTLHPEMSPGGKPASAGMDTPREVLEEHNLTGPEVKDELARTGKLVRRKADEAGASLAKVISNARIVSVINAKFTLDKDLSMRTINVDCEQGSVTLSGTVSSPEHVSKAVAIALDTEGVRQVSSYLAVQAQHTQP